jgi:hypothetical protein
MAGRPPEQLTLKPLKNGLRVRCDGGQAERRDCPAVAPLAGFKKQHQGTGARMINSDTDINRCSAGCRFTSRLQLCRVWYLIRSVTVALRHGGNNASCRVAARSAAQRSPAGQQLAYALLVIRIRLCAVDSEGGHGEHLRHPASPPFR